MPFLIVFVAIIAIGAIFSFGTAIGTGIAIATGTPISGTASSDATEAAASGFHLDDISQKISKIRPDDLPLDTVLRELGAGEKASAWKVDFYENTTRNMSIQVNDATNAADTSGGIDVVFDDVAHVNVDDVFYVPTVYAAGSSGDRLNVQVVAKNVGTKTLTIVAINGAVTGGDIYTDILAIPNDTVMYRIGNAKNELAAQNTAFQMMPSKAYNYNQIHMSQVEEGVYEAMLLTEVDYGLLDFKADSLKVRSQ